MGLDGGTIISRADVIRGASWDLTNSDTSRSSRGGSIDPGAVWKRRKLDKQQERSVPTIPFDVHA